MRVSPGLSAGTSQQAKVLPLDNEMPPSADHVISQGSNPDAATDATSPEAAQPSSFEDNKQLPVDDTPKVHVSERTESPDGETSHKPPVQEDQEQVKVDEATGKGSFIYYFQYIL